MVRSSPHYDSQFLGRIAKELADTSNNASVSTPTLAVLGDSRLVAGYTTLFNQAFYNTTGPSCWIESLSRGRARALFSLNFAVGGFTTTQVIQQKLASVMSSTANIVVVLASINDANAGVVVGTSLTNLAFIVNQIVGVGKICILIPELPRGPAGALSGSGLNEHFQIAQYLRTFASIPGVYIADPWLDVCDPIDANGSWISTYTLDGLHPNTIGAYFMGKAIARVLNIIYPEPGLLASSNADRYNAVSNPRGNLFANGMLDGTAGTKTLATGNFADSWAAVASATIALVGSKVNSAITGRAMQQIAVTVTNAASTHSGTFAPTLTLGNFLPGDTVEFVGEIEVDSGGTVIPPPFFQVQITVDGVNYTSRTLFGSSSVTNGALPSEAWQGIFRTPPIQIPPTGISISAATCIVVMPAFINQTGGYTFRIGKCSLRKV